MESRITNTEMTEPTQATYDALFQQEGAEVGFNAHHDSLGKDDSALLLAC